MNVHQLSGGTSRETWSFDAGGRGLILQCQRQSDDAVRLGLDSQTALLRAVRAASVPVPEVVASGEGDPDVGDWMIVERLDGETIPRKILRDDTFAAVRPRLTADVATALARIHSIPLGTVASLERRDEVAAYRRILDDVGEPHPAFELAFRWLERNRPPPSEPAVVHGDFRMGNFIVSAGGLRAVLDWELAHIGDPLEDLGWICVKSWRFGGTLPVGGFGKREELHADYERASGRTIDPDAARWWEVFGTLRWGVICIMQAMRHLSGAERSVELAAIGRRVAEVEHDVMAYLP
ncbi:MAG: phosphotransferase family protein [Actinobacteria bacterium]|nr:phosphotransferase family protein [Actinomycetota bacterium]